MNNQPKDYLGYENERNKKSGELFVEMVKTAFGDDNDVLIGHHLTFERHGDISTENEIPSADTLIFDHQIMEACFTHHAFTVMKDLAITPVESRDEKLRWWWDRFSVKADILKAG